MHCILSLGITAAEVPGNASDNTATHTAVSLRKSIKPSWDTEDHEIVVGAILSWLR